MAIMMLHPRDNMGFQIAPALIIFLVILGGGLVLCCVFAVYRMFSGDVDCDSSWTARCPKQDAYMREVRERSWSTLLGHEKRVVYSPSDPNLAHAPTSQSVGNSSVYG